MERTGLLNSINVTRVCRDLVTNKAKTNSAAEITHHLDMIETELDSTLTTVLCDATIRDIIHDNYSAQPETVDVKVLVEFLLVGKRFILHIDPEMPKLIVDRQLLRIIVGNSVSNAAKYGEVGITVARCNRVADRHDCATGGRPDRHHLEIFKFFLVAEHHQHAW